MGGKGGRVPWTLMGRLAWGMKCSRTGKRVSQTKVEGMNRVLKLVLTFTGENIFTPKHHTHTYQ